jgi:Arylsulfotransferase (ASST)
VAIIGAVSDHFAKRIFAFSIAFLIAAAGFAYGLAVERRHMWPYETMNLAWYSIKSYYRFGEFVPEGRRILPPDGAAREPITIYRHDLMNDGYLVIVGWDSEAQLYSAWLYDKRGQLLHTWPIDYLALDPDGPSNGADNPHPFHVFEDGSIIVGFDKGDVMARLDACGKPMWIKDGVFHHAMSRADDGTYWVWRGDHTAYGQYHYLVNFDPATGKTLREIGLIEDLIQSSPDTAAIFAVRPDFPFQKFKRDPENQETNDLFHPNDVDVLTADLAPAFPMFKPGDLLLSFRTINLVAVLDPDDLRIKWWSTGPWIGQHDPDFAPDGQISVFDNNTGRRRSEIIKMNPVTRNVSNELYSGETKFHSDYMGKHQYLPNGNVLIVVPAEGRVLEVSPSGGKVMEFNNISTHAPDYNEHVENGVWIPSDYFDGMPNCSNQRS